MKRLFAISFIFLLLITPVAANPLDDFLNWISGGSDTAVDNTTVINNTINITSYSLNTTVNVLEWDENKIVINYTVNESACTDRCFLKVLHDDFGYSTCWFDFDISNKLSGTIVTSPAESNMEIYRHNWYISIETRGLFTDMEQNFTRIFSISSDMMPVVTNKYSMGV